MLATIGYEKSSPEDFFRTLRDSNIEVLVDIRDRPQSRRPGFSKRALSDSSKKNGIEYIHIKALGDPKDGRDAARAGMVKMFRKIFSRVLESEQAQEALLEVIELAKSKRICLMCYERDPQSCHRKMVTDYLEATFGCGAVHLGVQDHGSEWRLSRRVLHPRQGAAT